MLGTRVLGYGKEYEVTITDPDAGLEVDTSFDLSKLKQKKLMRNFLKMVISLILLYLLQKEL